MSCGFLVYLLSYESSSEVGSLGTAPLTSEQTDRVAAQLMLLLWLQSGEQTSGLNQKLNCWPESSLRWCLSDLRGSLRSSWGLCDPWMGHRGGSENLREILEKFFRSFHGTLRRFQGPRRDSSCAEGIIGSEHTSRCLRWGPSAPSGCLRDFDWVDQHLSVKHQSCC